MTALYLNLMKTAVLCFLRQSAGAWGASSLLAATWGSTQIKLLALYSPLFQHCHGNGDKAQLLSQDSECSPSLRDEWNEATRKISPSHPHLRDVDDVRVLVILAGINGSTSFALQIQRDKSLQKEITKQLTTQLIYIWSEKLFMSH